MLVRIGAYRRLLGAYVRPQWPAVLLLSVLLLVSIALQLANPQVVRYFIDTASSGTHGAHGALLAAAVLFIAVALVQRALAFAAVYLGENVGWRATNALRADLVRHCLRLDLPFHAAHIPGELIERVDGDVTLLADFFAQMVVQILGQALLVLGILVLLAFVNPWLGAALGAYTAVTVVALLWVQRSAVHRWTASRQASAEHYGFLEEHLADTEEVRANGAEPYVMRRLSRLIHALMEHQRHARLTGNMTFLAAHGLYALGYALGLGLGAALFLDRQVSLGTVYVIVYYISLLYRPLDQIQENVQDLQRAQAGIGRIQELQRLQPRVRDAGPPRTVLPDRAPALEFRAVCFAYARPDDEAARQALDGVSFHVEPGQVMGLVGRSGSGKSTLARLLFRLYDPTGGAILLDGADLRELALADLRARIGMVTQEVQLFGASLRDNLALFNPRLSDRRIEQVLDEVGLGDWYRALPAGLDTALAAGGGLSAGQAQLLAFARVFLREPSMVILDEASSRLDPATERLLGQAMERLLRGRTAIVIAHRLNTIRRADTILVLEHGRVAEFGPRERLMQDPDSHFARLLRRDSSSHEVTIA